MLQSAWGNVEQADDEQEHEHNPDTGQYAPPRYNSKWDIKWKYVSETFYRLASGDESGEPNHQADAIVYYSGHGYPGFLARDGDEDWEHELHAGPGDNDPDNDLYYISNLGAGALDRCLLVMLVTCDSHTDPPGPKPSVLNAFMSLGAGCGIGSNAPVYDPWARSFSRIFWLYVCRDGATISAAFDDARWESESPLGVWHIEGASGETLRPGKYR